MNALFYLMLCSYRNRLLVRLKRLKEPRYLIGLIVGLGYLWMVFLRPRLNSGGQADGMPNAEEIRMVMQLVGAAFLYLIASTAVIPSPAGAGAALNFTQADVQFLFPAPLSREQLIRYKLIRGLVPTLIGSAITTLFFGGRNLQHGGIVFAGMTVIFVSLNLYTTGTSLHRGSGGALRRLPSIVAAGATVLLVLTVVRQWSALSAVHGGREILAEVERLSTTGPAGLVLWPFLALTRLPAAHSFSEFVRALPGPLLIVVLCYIWVIRSKASFEEGSAELADRVARIRKGQRLEPNPGVVRKTAQVRRAPFKLALEGRPETAILWKNLISAGRNIFSNRLLVGFFAGAGGAMIAISVFTRNEHVGSRPAGAVLIGGLAAAVYGFTVLLGPQIARMDLRQDLANLDVLKTWPISGAELVRGEVLAPAVILTTIAWLCIIVLLGFAAVPRFQPSWILAAAIITPGVLLLELLAQNAIAVMWPAWAVVGPLRPRGIDVMGQRLLTMVGLLLTVVVALLPAAVVGGVIGFGLHLLIGGVPVIFPALAASAVLFAEAFVFSDLIGRMLNRTDISALDAQE